MPPRRIIVGYDATVDAQAAVAWALDEAASTGAAVDLLHVRGTAGPVCAGDLERTVRSMLDDAAALARRAHTKPCTSISIVTGSPAAALIERSAGAGLVVLGGREQGSVAGRLGSVSVAITAHARCPVVVVRGDEAPADPIIVGIDGSASARAALAFAAEQADRRRVPLRVFHAGQQRPGPAADNLLDRCRSRHPDLDIITETLPGRPAAALAEASAGAQLLVVGSRGHGAVRGLLLGSVSQHLLRHSARPVAVVHARKPVNRTPAHQEVEPRS